MKRSPFKALAGGESASGEAVTDIVGIEAYTALDDFATKAIIYLFIPEDVCLAITQPHNHDPRLYASEEYSEKRFPPRC